MEKKQLRMLMIGAHPDDCEFDTGGIALKYRALGHIVKFVCVTNGDAGHHKMEGEQLSLRRKQEAINACSIAGIECQVFDIHDGYLEANIPTREKIIRLIREFKPDIIFTHRPNDYHPDHRNTSILVQDSSFLVCVPNVCPETPALTYQPIIVYMHDTFKKPIEFVPDIVVDIDDVIDDKVKMLDCHKSQVYEWLPWLDGYLDSVPENEEDRINWLKQRILRRDGNIAECFREKLVKRYGNNRGNNVKCAEVFEISEYGGPLTEEMINYYFPF